MLYLYVRLYCFKLYILVILFVTLTIFLLKRTLVLTFLFQNSVPNKKISLYFLFVQNVYVACLDSWKGRWNYVFFLLLRDRFRTTVNVLGDSIVAGVVEHLSRDDLKNFDDYNGVMNEAVPLSNRDESRELDEIAITTRL